MKNKNLVQSLKYNNNTYMVFNLDSKYQLDKLHEMKRKTQEFIDLLNSYVNESADYILH
jgi:hypothetical protein